MSDRKSEVECIIPILRVNSVAGQHPFTWMCSASKWIGAAS